MPFLGRLLHLQMSCACPIRNEGKRGFPAAALNCVGEENSLSDCVSKDTSRPTDG